MNAADHPKTQLEVRAEVLGAPPRDVTDSGPSWIRTRDQSVMSQGQASWQGVPPGHSAGQALERSEARGGGAGPIVGTVSTVSSRGTAPALRTSLRPIEVLLTVREVAEALKVCRATIYALVDRGQLERVWVGASMRIPAPSVAGYLTGGGR